MFALLIVATGCKDGRGIPSLRETYRYTDSNPFGTSMAYSLMQHMYPGYLVNIKKEGFDKTIKWFNDKSSLYLCISRYFFPSENDKKSLLEFVARGNTVLISASEIDSAFLSELGYELNANGKSLIPELQLFKKTSVSLSDWADAENNKYEYYYLPFIRYFSATNLAGSRQVGYNQDGKNNCTVIFWGRGRIYLHCSPAAFSNYFLLTANNHQYLKQLFQSFPANPENLYWDDYYNKMSARPAENGGASWLGFIMAIPALSWAFLLILALAIAFILAGMKRRQRMVPIIKPVENSSIRFAESIAGLYLNGKNNRDIAEKMITYFNEHIRSHYFLSIHTVNNDFMDTLSRKSGMPLEKTKALYSTIAMINAAEQVDDILLLQLNNQIQEFNKLKN